MPNKVYIKTPRGMRVVMIAQIVIATLFLPFGIMIIAVAEGEARPFAVMFSLIWFAGCGAIIYQAVKGIKVIDRGEFPIAEVRFEGEGKAENFPEKLRELEKLKDEKLISPEEYRKKREEIMKEKW